MNRWILTIALIWVYSTGQATCTTKDFEAAIVSAKIFKLECTQVLIEEISNLINPGDSLLKLFHTIKSSSNPRNIKESHYRLLLRLCETSEGNNHVKANIHYRLGLMNYSQDLYDEAIHSFQNAAENWLRSSNPDSTQIGKSYLNIGVCQFYIQNYFDAEKNFKKVANENWPLPARHQAKNLMMLGNISGIKGNIKLAEQYLKLSGVKHFEATHDSVYIATSVYRNLGILNLKFKKYHEAHNYFTKSLNILNKSDLNSQSIKTELRRDKFNLATTFMKQKMFSDAIKIYESLLTSNTETIGFEEYTQILINLAVARLDNDQIEAAEELLHRSDSLLALNPNEYLQRLVAINQGQVLRRKGKFKLAIEIQKESLARCCSIDFDQLVTKLSPSINNEHAEDVIGTLTRVAVILRDRYRSTENKADLKNSLEYYKAAANFINQLKTNQFDPKFSVNLGALSTDLTEEVLLLSQDNKDWTPELYNFVEKSKSTSLLASIQTADAESHFIDRFPAIQEVLSIKAEILEVENELINESLSIQEKIGLREKLLSLNEKLREANKEKMGVLAKEKALTNLYQSLPTEEIQKLLEDKSTILSYFMTDDLMYIFVINASSIELIQKEITPKNFNALYRLIQTSSGELMNSGEWVSYCNDASELLIGDILGKTGENLIIIPDDILAYLPFEMLLTSLTDTTSSFRNLPYLIKEKAISYNFSGSILKEMMESEASGKGLLSMAPEFNLADGLASRGGAAVPLAHAKKEVDAINAIWKPKHRPENKEEFVQNIGDANIIHFAGHAFLNDEVAENSYLAFSSRSDMEDKLFIREIYNLSTPSELVVLSACNTGQGELKKGEGVMSMARAFAYSGAKSLVYSLWDVNDSSTKKIMERFYQELKSGASKDEALQTAKLAYIDNAVDNTNHPYFWAGFVAMGDMSPIEISSVNWTFYMLVGLALVLGLWFFWWRSQK